jgi:hypothetical protein
MYSANAKKLVLLACIAEMSNRYYASQSIAIRHQWIKTAGHLADGTQIVGAIPKNIKIASDALDPQHTPVLLPTPKDEGIDDATWLIKHREHLAYNPSKLKPLNNIPVAFEATWKEVSKLIRDKEVNVSTILFFCTEFLNSNEEFSKELREALSQ